MLYRKLLRDIKLNKAQFITILLMVFIGLFVYSGVTGYMQGMQSGVDTYYAKNNFQDIWVSGNNFTKDDLENIKSIDNIKNAERKLTLIGSTENIKDSTIQINFIENNEINKFEVIEGEEFSKDKKGVWLDSYLANTNNLKVGDILKIQYDTYTIEEEILGLILVPTHVYDIKSEAEIFPTHIDYGFVFLSSNQFPMEPEYVPYNSVMIDVNNTDIIVQTKLEIENKIENAIAVTDRNSDVSSETFQGEIEEGNTYVGIFSGIFLIIAVLSVITTMTRVIKKQRTEIGTLKALGFSNKRITKLYVGYGFWVSLLGAILGVIVGPFLLSKLFLSMMVEFYEVPNLVAKISSTSYLIAGITVLIISLITYLTCRSQLNEKAADILRVEIPKVKNTKLNFNNGIFKYASFSTKWNLRDFARSKARTIMGVFGVTSCAALIICAFGLFDSLTGYLDWQFDKLYKFNYKISLESNYTEEQYSEIANKYGDSSSQTLAVEIKTGNSKKVNTVTVDKSNGLLEYTDSRLNNITLKDNGVYITSKLAKVEGFELGDEISWHIFGDENWHTSKIIGFNRSPQLQNITMTSNYMESLGLKYRPDSLYTNIDAYNDKNLSGVSVIQNKDEIRQGIESMLEAMKTMIVIMIAAAIILGVVIIYNLGILLFTEKTYQFATLKVLGFKLKQIQKIFIKQNIWITVISVILGMPVGYYLVYFIYKLALSDSYDMIANITLLSYVYGVVGTIIVSVIVNWLLSKKVKSINMVESLKANE